MTGKTHVKASDANTHMHTNTRVHPRPQSQWTYEIAVPFNFETGVNLTFSGEKTDSIVRESERMDGY